MKVLYAFQGTGNGHVTRAREIIPHLRRKVDLDILISGTQADIDSGQDIRFRMHGLSFIFGKKGGINYTKTLKDFKPVRLAKDIFSLPVKNYDLIINDFEPISAWASRIHNIPCFALSHQAAVLHPAAPKPEKIDIPGEFILKNYAPAKWHSGFHFRKYGENIFTPVIRTEIRNAIPVNGGHVTVYLPAWGDDEIARTLKPLKDVRWHIFSKHSRIHYKYENLEIFPIDNKLFVQSMVSSIGVVCGAGFETPAEVLFLGKKLFAVPMSGQFEQQCNASALTGMGITVAPTIDSQTTNLLREWLYNDRIITVEYNDETESIVNTVLQTVWSEQSSRRKMT